MKTIKFVEMRPREIIEMYWNTTLNIEPDAMVLDVEFLKVA